MFCVRPVSVVRVVPLRLLLALLSVPLAALLSGCNVSSLTAAGSDLLTAVTVSNDELVQASEQMRAQGDAEADVPAENNKYARRLARLMDAHRGEDGLSLNFKVYLTEDINANASADGSIRVYSGIMDMMTDQELLFILGHEIGHVYSGDTLDKVRTAYTASAARKGASAAGGVTGLLSDSLLGDLLESVVNAQFSQNEESDADMYGYEFMKKHGYDVKAAVSALKKLDSLGESGGFLASHPNAGERAEVIQARIAADK